MKSVQVTDVTVSTNKIFCRVQAHNNLFSNAQIKDSLLEIRPTLAAHNCKNLSGKSFVDVMDSTSIPHLLEHLIIDLQVEYLENANISVKPIFGTTEWLDKSAGTAKITLSFMDDVIALKAIKDAANLLNSII